MNTKTTINYLVNAILCCMLCCCAESGPKGDNNPENNTHPDSIMSNNDSIQNTTPQIVENESDNLEADSIRPDFEIIRAIMQEDDYPESGGPAENMMSLKSPSRTIRVNTIEKFINTLSSDVTVIVNINTTEDMNEDDYYNYGKINISEALEELPIFDRDKANEIEPGVYSNGGGLVLYGLKNLTIQGESSNPENTHFVITKSIYDVFQVENCSNIKIQNLKLGHFFSETCSGDAFNINNSSNIEINNCELYGCGFNGLSIENSQNINVSKTTIYACSNCALTLDSCKNVLLSECVLKDCPFGFSTTPTSQRLEFRNCYLTEEMLRTIQGPAKFTNSYLIRTDNDEGPGQ